LSRRFSVTAIHNREDGRPWKLRLITTPVHEYSTEDGDQVVSGFLNVFCRATDPEAMLALEVRKNSNGEYRWYHALANCSDAGAHLILGRFDDWQSR
jgi:hypothetical protein